MADKSLALASTELRDEIREILSFAVEQIMAQGGHIPLALALLPGHGHSHFHSR